MDLRSRALTQGTCYQSAAERPDGRADQPLRLVTGPIHRDTEVDDVRGEVGKQQLEGWSALLMWPRSGS